MSTHGLLTELTLMRSQRALTIPIFDYGEAPKQTQTPNSFCAMNVAELSLKNDHCIELFLAERVTSQQILNAFGQLFITASGGVGYIHPSLGINSRQDDSFLFDPNKSGLREVINPRILVWNIFAYEQLISPRNSQATENNIAKTSVWKIFENTVLIPHGPNSLVAFFESLRTQLKEKEIRGVISDEDHLLAGATLMVYPFVYDDTTFYVNRCGMMLPAMLIGKVEKS